MSYKLAIFVDLGTAVFARLERIRLGRGSTMTDSELVDISAAATDDERL
jgi:hypothetical protein